MVLERGSNTARMRCQRRPCGAARRRWCASRSGGARSRRRPSRRRPRRAVPGGGARSRSWPAPPPPPRAPRPHARPRRSRPARSAGCARPAAASRHGAIFRLPRSTSKACGSPRARRPPGSSLRVPKRCTSLQQPRASTRCSASSRALTTSRPLAGTVRTRWWNWRLDGGQVGEDVGVVELQVVQDRGARPVVHELAALVEEGGVVLVGFDDEGAVPRWPSRAETPKFSGTPPTRKPGLQAGRFQHPGQHRGGGGLAVRAGHGQHMAALQHVLGQPLRAAGVGARRRRGWPPSARLPRVTTLPTTNRSGLRAICSAP